MDLNIDSLKMAFAAAFGVTVASLIAGRFFKRLILLPFQKIAEKTENKIDDQLIEDAKKDLHLDD